MELDTPLTCTITLFVHELQTHGRSVSVVMVRELIYALKSLGITKTSGWIKPRQFNARKASGKWEMIPRSMRGRNVCVITGMCEIAHVVTRTSVEIEITTK